jgi:hypothetical protein
MLWLAAHFNACDDGRNVVQVLLLQASDNSFIGSGTTTQTIPGIWKGGKPNNTKIYEAKAFQYSALRYDPAYGLGNDGCYAPQSSGRRISPFEPVSSTGPPKTRNTHEGGKSRFAHGISAPASKMTS